jgi:hypothetical protein
VLSSTQPLEKISEIVDDKNSVCSYTATPVNYIFVLITKLTENSVVILYVNLQPKERYCFNVME